MDNSDRENNDELLESKLMCQYFFLSNFLPYSNYVAIIGDFNSSKV